MAETRPVLVVLGGLPGAGKSSVAEGVARQLPAAIISVDPIEAAMWRSGLERSATGIAAYDVAVALAGEQLKAGLSAVADAVNPVESARAMWRELSAAHDASLAFIEVVCSDRGLHQRRIEARVRAIPGMSEITWEQVDARTREFEPWAEPHLVLDSATDSPERLHAQAIAYIRAISS
ncbi:MAG TPA: AAA family ATPase [Phenylobacterium sp.]